MQRLFSLLIFAGLIIGLAYAYRTPLGTVALQTRAHFLPCTQPITYSIGSVDSRFGISTAEVRASLLAASSVWNKAAGHPLFAYAQRGGEVTVNFLYDDRQATAVRLRSLGISISNDKTSYDAVNSEYQKITAAYNAEKTRFDTESAALDRDIASYEAEVRAANARGGATPEEYDRLQREKADLGARRDALLALQQRVNTDATDINALVTTLNRLAVVVNAAASTYNSTARTDGKEFEEANYETALGSESINVYEFDSSARLVRVLSHELGHALGLEHVDDADAIMYRLNQSKNATPTTADMSELHRVCSK